RPATPLLLFFPTPAPPDLYTLSLHDALPILPRPPRGQGRLARLLGGGRVRRAGQIGLRYRGRERARRVRLLVSLNGRAEVLAVQDRKSTRLNSSHDQISYAVFCLKKKRKIKT